MSRNSQLSTLNYQLPTNDRTGNPRTVGTLRVTAFRAVLIDFDGNRFSIGGRTVCRDDRIFPCREIDNQW
jgi:hypothetical protein